jgi:response regulator of citrate/malate metabolism
MHILIVEDDILFGEILQVFLTSKKCTTILASSLGAAKLHLSNSIFDFVLLDNNLPDGTGISFLPRIGDIAKTPVPVMMITGDSNQAVMADAFESGADDFLVKPLSLDLLWHKLRRLRSVFDKEVKLEEQTIRLEKLLNQQAHEEELARYVYEHVSSTLQTETDCVDTYLQSSSLFNGDVFICDTAPNGNRFVLLADATGHGLSAAISILPLVSTIRAMIRKGYSLHHIIHEANQKLCKELPDDKFVALIGVEVNFHKKSMLLFNGGMPDVISVGHDKTLIRTPSTSLSLGILEPEDFDPGIITLETDPIRNLFFFSDGLIEQQNSAGKEFGMARVIDIIADWDSQEPLLSRMINHFTVFNELNELQDDLSVCNLQVQVLMEKSRLEGELNKNRKNGKIIASIMIEGNLIAATDIIGIFDSLMKCVDVVGDFRQKAFTVFAELISNALDHGILDLDSALKNDFSGFAEYVALKEERLANMAADNTLEISFTYLPQVQEMMFSITDSGSGYNYTSTSEMEDLALSGRGIPLINKLCKTVDVQGSGNSTSVTLKREL